MQDIIKNNQKIGEAWEKHGIYFVSVFAKYYIAETYCDSEDGEQEFEIPCFGVGQGWFDSEGALDHFIRNLTVDTLTNPFGGELAYADMSSGWEGLSFINEDSNRDVADEARKMEDEAADRLREEQERDDRIANWRFVPDSGNLWLEKSKRGFWYVIISIAGKRAWKVKNLKIMPRTEYEGWIFDEYSGHLFPDPETCKAWLIKSVKEFAWDEDAGNFRIVYKERSLKVSGDNLVMREMDNGIYFMLKEEDGVLLNTYKSYYNITGEYGDNIDNEMIQPIYCRNEIKTKNARSWFLDNVKEIKITAEGYRFALMSDGTISKG